MTRLLRSIAAPALLGIAVAAAGPRSSTAQVPAPKAAPADAGFVVIVNSANPVQTLTRDQLSKLFLKKTVRWQSGREVLPVDLAGRAEARLSFSQAVHRKPLVAINSYWQQQIYSGREVPPPAMRSERDVVEFVRSTPDAIGYVSARAELGRSIKVVTVQD